MIAKHICSKAACFRQSGAAIGKASARIPADRSVRVYNKEMLSFSNAVACGSNKSWLPSANGFRKRSSKEVER